MNGAIRARCGPLVTVALIAAMSACARRVPPVAPGVQAEWEELTGKCERDQVVAACLAAGALWQEGDGPPRDPRRAAALFRIGCVRGNLHACAAEANVVLDASPTPPESEAARRTLQQGCFESGSVTACLYLGVHESEATWATGADAEDAALRAWSWACDELGDENACFVVGMGLREWRGDAGTTSAHGFFVRACAAEHPMACRKVADAQACGKGVPVSRVEAVRNYLLACRKEDEPSCSLAAGYFERMDAQEREAVGVELGPVPRILATRAAARGARADAQSRALSLPRDEAAWIRAGLALDAGEFRDARNWLSELRDERPGAPEAALMEVAIASAEAGVPIFLPVVEAWLRAGKPDLRSNGLVEVPMPFWETDCHEFFRSCLRDETRVEAPVLYGLTTRWSGAPAEILAEAARIADDAPTADRLGALSALNHPESRKRLDAAQEVARRRVARSFAGDRSAFGTFVVLTAEDADQPLSAGERQALLTARGWEVPRDALRKEVQVQLAALPQNSTCGENLEMAALVQVVTVADVFHVTRRVTATAPGLSAEERTQLGRRAIEVGEEIYRTGWLFDALTSVGLISAGAKMTGDPRDRARSQLLGEEVRRIIPQGAWVPELGLWPSRRLQDDIMRTVGDDEVGFQKRLQELTAD